MINTIIVIESQKYIIISGTASSLISKIGYFIFKYKFGINADRNNENAVTILTVNLFILYQSSQYCL